MEDNTKKYYTPTIDEFHVGFEYETNYNRKDWKEIKLTTEEAVNLFDIWDYDAVNTEFRVKYLDIEDIESFGFFHATSLKNYQENFRITNLLRRLNEEEGDAMYNEVRLQYAPDIHRVIIYGTVTGFEEEKFFEGVVKNKSELKKILEQLNIIDKK